MRDERMYGQADSPFPVPPLELVREGMVVVDVTGERVGTVELIQMGDPEAVTTQGEDYQVPGLVRDVVRSVVGAEPDVPEPLRSRLLRHGYIKIDGPGLTDTDRYTRGDQIASVAGDTVTLTAAKGRLAEEA